MAGLTGAGNAERPHRLDRDRRHRLQQSRRVGAAARSAEQLAHLVGEPTRDRQPDKLVVVRFDTATVGMRVRVEHDVDCRDLQRWNRDREVDDHVMHRQRLGVVGDVQPRRLLITNGTAQHEGVEAASKRAHRVHPLVHDLQLVIDAVRKAAGQLVCSVVPDEHVVDLRVDVIGRTEVNAFRSHRRRAYAAHGACPVPKRVRRGGSARWRCRRGCRVQWRCARRCQRPRKRRAGAARRHNAAEGVPPSE